MADTRYVRRERLELHEADRHRGFGLYETVPAGTPAAVELSLSRSTAIGIGRLAKALKLVPSARITIVRLDQDEMTWLGSVEDLKRLSSVDRMAPVANPRGLIAVLEVTPEVVSFSAYSPAVTNHRVVASSGRDGSTIRIDRLVEFFGIQPDELSLGHVSEATPHPPSRKLKA